MSRRGGVKVEGLVDLQRKLSIVTVRARQAAEKAVADEVDAVEADAKKGAPIGPTGDLSESIEGHASGLRGEVKTHERYATFVEHGTYKDKAQPYMAPAAERSRRRFTGRVAARVRAATEGVR